MTRCGMMTRCDMRLELPIRTVNSLNTREHWSKRAKRAKAHRNGVAMVVRAAHGGRELKPSGALTVTLTRIAPRALDGHDGLPASLKACVDGVADALGLANDRDARVTWLYSQRRGKPRQYAVELLLEVRR